MEWLKAERASTSSSSRVTVTQQSMPPPRVRSMREAGEPCR